MQHSWLPLFFIMTVFIPQLTHAQSSVQQSPVPTPRTVPEKPPTAQSRPSLPKNITDLPVHGNYLRMPSVSPSSEQPRSGAPIAPGKPPLPPHIANLPAHANFLGSYPPEPSPERPMLRIQVENQVFSRANTSLVVGLIVTDSQGRRVGIDTLADTSYQDIANAQVERIAARESRLTSESLVITIDPAVDTRYTVDVTGKPGGSYQLLVSGTSPTRQTIRLALHELIPPNTFMRYHVDLSKIQSEPPPSPNQVAVAGPSVHPIKAFFSSGELQVRVTSTDTLESICQRAHTTFSNVRGGQAQRNERSTFGGIRSRGCTVTLTAESNTLTGENDWPREYLYAYPGSELSSHGWVTDKEADGPCGSSFEIKSPTIICSYSMQGCLDELPPDELVDNATSPSNAQFQAIFTCTEQSH